MSRSEFKAAVKQAAWNTPAYFEDVLSYDKHTGVLTWLNRPRSHFSTDKGYRIFSTRDAGKPIRGGLTNGYMTVRLSKRLHLAHRICWMLGSGRPIPTGMRIDHIDIDPTNNRFCNLRLATPAENGWNKNQKAGKYLPKGVSWDKSRNKYVVWVRANSVAHFIGRFPSIEVAEGAAREALIKYHGEFARHG